METQRTANIYRKYFMKQHIDDENIIRIRLRLYAQIALLLAYSLITRSLYNGHALQQQHYTHTQTFVAVTAKAFVRMYCFVWFVSGSVQVHVC